MPPGSPPRLKFRWMPDNKGRFRYVKRPRTATPVKTQCTKDEHPALHRSTDLPRNPHHGIVALEPPPPRQPAPGVPWVEGRGSSMLSNFQKLTDWLLVHQDHHQVQRSKKMEPP